jgi:hypothetical protein
MGIEPTYQLVTGTLVLKTRRPTRRLGTSTRDNLIEIYLSCQWVNARQRSIFSN